MNQKKYSWLVTGGAGFIGAHLVRALVQNGQRVTVLDDFSAGARANLLPFGRAVRVLEGNILDLKTVKKACRGADFVLHHAALVSVPRSIEEPNETYQINVQGTANVLEAAKEARVKRVVFASSCAVYGPGKPQPFDETAPRRPGTPYALSKSQGEDLCRSYRDLYGTDCVILRYFNVYGPGQNPQGPYSAVIAKFLDCAARGLPLTMDWDGRQTRDFTFVEDVARANLWAALKARPGETYNVGTGRSESLLKLAALTEAAAGAKRGRVLRPKRAGDVRRSAADVSKARREGFETRFTLPEGLKICWEHLQKGKL